MAGTIGSILAEATTALAKAGGDEPRRGARRLVAGALHLTATELLMMPDRVIECSEVQRVRDLVRRLAKGEPLSRLLGRREFWGLNFRLSSDTLDPRPESETVIEAVLARVDRDATLGVLDLGTGSGCLLLSLLSELPAATGVGVDLSEGAATTARQNAQSLGLADRSCFFVGDWGTATAQRFDIIVANPPYIATSALCGLPRAVRGYDPRQALDGGDDALTAYRSIASQLHALLAPFAVFITEIGIGQATEVAAILRDQHLWIDAVERDLSGIERCVVARDTVSRHFEPAVAGQKTLGMRRRRV